MAGALMCLGYLAWSASSDDPQADSPRGVHSDALVQGAQPIADQSHALFPWGTAGGITEPTAGPGTHDRLLALLDEYQQGGHTPERKRDIRMAFAAAKQDPVARGFLMEWFWGARDPQRAQAVYALIRDADFKDQALIESLIQRDTPEADAVLKHRLIDLIADQNSVDEGTYSSAIDAYLYRLTQSADEQLRQAAISQRIWYVGQRHSDQLGSLAQLLKDPMPIVREEMYGLLESRLGSPAMVQARADFASVLTELAYSPDWIMSEPERARISGLLAALNRP